MGDQRTPIKSLVDDIVIKQKLYKKEYGHYGFSSAIVIVIYKNVEYLIDGCHRRGAMAILTEKDPEISITVIKIICKDENHANTLYLQHSNINAVNPVIENGMVTDIGKRSDALVNLLQTKYEGVWHKDKSIFPCIHIGKFIEKIKLHGILKHKNNIEIMEIINEKNKKYGKKFKNR